MFNIFNKFRNINILNILKKNNNYQTKLGRWNYENVNFKIDYANHDHCGDKICKDPKLVKKLNNNINK